MQYISSCQFAVGDEYAGEFNAHGYHLPEVDALI